MCSSVYSSPLTTDQWFMAFVCKRNGTKLAFLNQKKNQSKHEVYEGERERERYIFIFCINIECLVSFQRFFLNFQLLPLLHYQKREIFIFSLKHWQIIKYGKFSPTYIFLQYFFQKWSNAKGRYTSSSSFQFFMALEMDGRFS